MSVTITSLPIITSTSGASLSELPVARDGHVHRPRLVGVVGVRVGVRGPPEDHDIARHLAADPFRPFVRHDHRTTSLKLCNFSAPAAP